MTSPYEYSMSQVEYQKPVNWSNVVSILIDVKNLYEKARDIPESPQEAFLKFNRNPPPWMRRLGSLNWFPSTKELNEWLALNQADPKIPGLLSTLKETIELVPDIFDVLYLFLSSPDKVRGYLQNPQEWKRDLQQAVGAILGSARLLSQIISLAGPEKFTFQGFTVLNSYRFTNWMCIKPLSVIHRILQIFKQRGLSSSLMNGLKVINLMSGQVSSGG